MNPCRLITLLPAALRKGGYTDKEAERNILSNPFKRFENVQMLRHTKTLGIVQIDEAVMEASDRGGKRRNSGDMR